MGLVSKAVYNGGGHVLGYSFDQSLYLYVIHFSVNINWGCSSCVDSTLQNHSQNFDEQGGMDIES